MTKNTIKNLPETLNIWVLLYRESDGSFSFFDTTNDSERAGSALEWYGKELILVHKNTIK